MTQKQFNQIFKEATPNWQVMTITDRRLCYNELMEAFARAENITAKQRQTWGHPKFLTSHINKINCNAY